MALGRVAAAERDGPGVEQRAHRLEREAARMRARRVLAGKLHEERRQERCLDHEAGIVPVA